ncbi:MAG: alpha/beta hydrolase [Bacteroidota bacterium]
MIHYTDLGKGAPIVLIHGYLETSEVWDSFARKLAVSFRVIAVDLPGHGKSDLISETQTMESMAGSILEVIESLGLKKVFMTGHSLGGYVALAFAELFPEMLSGYCLFHSHPLENSPDNITKRESEIALVKAGKKDLIYPDNITRLFANDNLEKFASQLERSKKIASAIPGEAIAAVLNGMILRPSRVHVMESGKVPCLWILGTKDNYINYEAVRKKVSLPANAKLEILQNSGHIGFIEEENLSLSIIKSFVGRLHDCMTA